MPYEIVLDELPAGYSLSAAKGGEGSIVKVAVSEFVSSEDGDAFINRLEGFPNTILAKLPIGSGIKPSVVDHMIVIIRNNKTATAYVNEVNFIGNIQVKRSIEKGEPIYTDEIADIHSLIPQNVNIPDDAGLFILVSVGWRKGLFYDFRPIQVKDPRPRDYDINIVLGKLYCYLLFQDRFKISDEEWNWIIQQNWFPFISLNSATITDIVNYNRNSWNIDELLSKIKNEVDSKIHSMQEKWHNIKFFSSQVPFIDKAIEHYKDDDYISSISVLYPRIEGIMRAFHISRGSTEKATQANLVNSIVSSKNSHSISYSLLLHDRFRRFLSEVYFANFDPNGQKPLSRHSVSHGVAEAEKFSLKGAILGFLCLDQISFYIVGHDRTNNSFNTDV